MPIYLVDVEVTHSQRVKVEADTDQGARRAAAKRENWLDVVCDDGVIHVEPSNTWKTDDED